MDDGFREFLEGLMDNVDVDNNNARLRASGEQAPPGEGGAAHDGHAGALILDGPTLFSGQASNARSLAG
jgi:hypothetical protein